MKYKYKTEESKSGQYISAVMATLTELRRKYDLLALEPLEIGFNSDPARIHPETNEMEQILFEAFLRDMGDYFYKKHILFKILLKSELSDTGKFHYHGFLYLISHDDKLSDFDILKLFINYSRRNWGKSDVKPIKNWHLYYPYVCKQNFITSPVYYSNIKEKIHITNINKESVLLADVIKL